MAMTIDFSGKTVLITGAGRGLGKDIAYATVFMASDYAKEITGECLAIDGGSTYGR